ncbi:unnamed protein product (macronuclear) [Paramecium tetraurelia]|uniref:RING-CH-type domain-containing protein n=1 Tax=Paramecium tetraurelia TaxID=5888 RepID=A0DGZ0_PARTE|nr:uncharacterized protein GSPATT00002436001 [Paramecium tetraurelia]CAK82307.1 unnamed protein product [Paramecium tetraurelia]|eukprot:XP_001449704.1 hypothetical protein (macronuclear) [Paramecium tetraurelia strain d4-2]
MNSSIQFIPDITQENLTDQVPLPQKETITKGILKTFYYEDIKRKKIIGCNIYVNEMNDKQLQLSKRGKQCRICMADEETSRFITPCACKGTLMNVHEECLKLWILQKNGIEDVFKDKIKCELCSYRFRMRMQIVNRVSLKRFSEVPSHQKICWLVYLFVIISLISGFVALYMEYNLTNIGVDAVMTLIIVLSLILFVYFLASILTSLQIEMIENWTLSPYKPRRDTKQGSFFQLQSHMGHSISGSPLARRRTVQLQTCPPQITSLQVIQINQLMTSANLSEQ